MKKTLLASASAVALLSTGFAHAQGVDEDGFTELPEILVTAGRTPVEQEKTGRAFTVIDGDQLEENGTRQVSDVLRQVPGVAVSRSGGVGGLTQIRLRGAEANHVLVLVDGVEISAVGNGEYDFGGMQASAIERIEVLRGPQSSFFGSNATAGVINIITKRGDRDGWNVEAVAEAGTDSSFLGGVSVYAGQDNFDAAFSLRYRETEGFNISREGDEEDGDQNLTFTGRLNVDLNENLAIDLNARFVDRLSESDGAPFGLPIDTDDETSTQEFSGSVGATWTSLDGAWTHIARLSGSTDDTEFFEEGERTFGSEGNRLKGTLQSTYAFETPALADANHSITVGYEWERERFNQLEPAELTFFNDPSQFEEQERETHSFVAEYRGEFADQFYLNAAIRHDLNDEFKDATTYSLATAWAIPNTGTRLHASVGTGITNPTFFEQFGFIPASFIGNPDLKPEESFGWDIGVEQTFLGGDLVVDVTYFNQDLTDEIGTVFLPTFESTVENQNGKSERQGVEIAATARLFEGFTATATYTYTDTTDPDDVVEIRVPEHAASLNAAYTFYDERARVFAELIYNGEMEDLSFATFPAERVTLDDYMTVNIGGSFEFNEHFEAYGRVENLFDENYEEVFGYQAQGRTAFFGIKGRF